MEWEVRELLGLWLQQFIIQPIFRVTVIMLAKLPSYNTEPFKRDIFSHLFKVYGGYAHDN